MTTSKYPFIKSLGLEVTDKTNGFYQPIWVSADDLEKALSRLMGGREMNKAKLDINMATKIWMNKKTGQLVEVNNSWLGLIIFKKEIQDDELLSNHSESIIYDDQKESNPALWEDLGEL